MIHGDESAGNAIPGLTLPLFAAMIERIAYWKILEGAALPLRQARPFVFLTFKLRGLAKTRPADAGYEGARAQPQADGDAPRRAGEAARASTGPWILGETFSLADVSWLVIFERLVQADCLHVFVGEGRRPECAAYWAPPSARPGYEQAILDHAHDR